MAEYGSAFRRWQRSRPCELSPFPSTSTIAGRERSVIDSIWAASPSATDGKPLPDNQAATRGGIGRPVGVKNMTVGRVRTGFLSQSARTLQVRKLERACPE